MRMQNSRWLKWVLDESARETTSLPFARGERRAATIARRATSAAVSASQNEPRQPARAQS